MAPTFTYNKKAQRYQFVDGPQAGQFVSPSQIQAITNGYIRYRQNHFAIK